MVEGLVATRRLSCVLSIGDLSFGLSSFEELSLDDLDEDVEEGAAKALKLLLLLLLLWLVEVVVLVLVSTQ